MAGMPQLRESGLLYGDDPLLPVAMVRLEEHADGHWVVLLNSPAEAQDPKRWERPDEVGARAVLEEIYREGREKGGEWRIHRLTTDWPTPADR